MEQLIEMHHEWEVRLTLRSKFGAPQTHKSGPFRKRSTAEAVAEKLSEQDDLLSVQIVDLLAEEEFRRAVAGHNQMVAVEPFAHDAVDN